MSRPPNEMPPGRRPSGGPERRGPGDGSQPNSPAPSWTRMLPWLLIIALVGVFVLTNVFSTSGTSSKDLTYSQFITAVQNDTVKKVEFDTSSGDISGSFKSTTDGTKDFTSSGPSNDLQDSAIKLLRDHGVQLKYTHPTSNFLTDLLPLLIPIGLLILFFVWMSRRAQGQMGAVMNIGRSRAKVYNTEKPKTTFDDVAGYGPVKAEIAEVVDFLKYPGQVQADRRAHPQGRAARRPARHRQDAHRPRSPVRPACRSSRSRAPTSWRCSSVSAPARVRDLFQTARKQAPAIIFVDEIDSIGRKRGAGLGGGHDEREQTLNQMLAEMDGFEATEGIVMMAATNRPDVLDSALLRPGRFDRQIVVPLPTQEERAQILQVHMRDKKIGPDVNVDVIARGTPGMAGADLSNLVNEAALSRCAEACRLWRHKDFDAARDRVLMGLKRDSMAISEEEKEIIAYHEGGHAVLAYVLDHADPVHKVTILPTGMALGVTQQLPEEEQHIYKREYIADSISVALGGRISEEIVFGHVSTGAQNDLVRITEMARKMVREWGMSDRIGPMAWGSQGPVFLGEDLVHTRDYSDETARVIDEEVERILRQEESRARRILRLHRRGLDAVARSLLERETLDGQEVAHLVDTAMGRKAGGYRKVKRADGTVVEVKPPAENGGKTAARKAAASGTTRRARARR